MRANSRAIACKRATRFSSSSTTTPTNKTQPSPLSAGGGGRLSFDVLPPRAILEHAFDKIVIASFSGAGEIRAQLAEMGIAPHRIDDSYVAPYLAARQSFLQNFASLAKERALSGDCAEVGVYRGDFARHINAHFPTKKLYLFDTFEGFAAADLRSESAHVAGMGAGHLGNTSVALVLSKMPHKEQCVVRKGWFPDTARGLEDTRFCFVRLDTDLYDPILAGLAFFYPRLVPGGILVVDDYFSAYDGVKKAVDAFATESQIPIVPVGDGISVVLAKP